MTPRAGVPITLETVEATEALGEELGRLAIAGDLIVLDGPLGAGKTALTRGIGRGLGISGVTSPTFVMARVHTGGRLPLVHVDAYRLRGLDDLESLDLDATLEESLTVVEWGTGVVEGLAAEHLVVRIDRNTGDELRLARLEPQGPGWEARLRSI